MQCLFYLVQKHFVCFRLFKSGSQKLKQITKQDKKHKKVLKSHNRANHFFPSVIVILSKFLYLCFFFFKLVCTKSLKKFAHVGNCENSTIHLYQSLTIRKYKEILTQGQLFYPKWISLIFCEAHLVPLKTATMGPIF